MRNLIIYWGKIDTKGEEFSKLTCQASCYNWTTDQTRTDGHQSWILEGLQEPDWSVLRESLSNSKWNIRKRNTEALSKTDGWFFLPYWEADAMFKNLFKAQVVQFNLQPINWAVLSYLPGTFCESTTTTTSGKRVWAASTLQTLQVFFPMANVKLYRGFWEMYNLHCSMLWDYTRDKSSAEGDTTVQHCIPCFKVNS